MELLRRGAAPRACETAASKSRGAPGGGPRSGEPGAAARLGAALPERPRPRVASARASAGLALAGERRRNETGAAPAAGR